MKNKAIPFKIQKSAQHALLVQVDEQPYFYNRLHYHPEFQISAIAKGEGIFYAGNNMTAFAETDVFLIGANVPHLLQCSNLYYATDSPGVKGISLFFDELSFGDHFFAISEMQNIRQLLTDAKRILKVQDHLKTVIFDKIVAASTLKQEQLIIAFLEILALLHQAKKTYLNSEQYHLTLNRNEGDRFSEVLDYTFRHFRQEITIEQVAKIAFLSRSQFSSFFKAHTGKSYIRFLNELRIENACLLLKNEHYTIERICYEVGFHNRSNFARQFKKIKDITPSAYRKSWSMD